jgi:hypothetical protein
MYIIQEIQTNNSQTALLPALTYTNRDEAESAYHMKLGSAAISTVSIHTVIMYDEHGNILRREYYEHDTNES